MKRLLKIILSISVYIFCLMALADVLSGGEPLVDEFVILGLGAFWTAYLIKPFKLPKFLKAFLIFLVSAVLHNIISHLSKTEETLFFTLALLSFLLSLILFLTLIFKKTKVKLLKSSIFHPPFP